MLSYFMPYPASELKAVVRRLLQARERKTITDGGLTPAAVLILLYQKGDKLHLLLTKRTDRVAYHKNQISFPGGCQDAEDSTLVLTALRECNEEVGLESGCIEILGALDDQPTVSNFVITPYVGFVEKLPPVLPCREEVAEVLEVPVDKVLDPSYPLEMFAPGETPPRKVPAYPFDGHVIWGATAMILGQLIKVLRPVLSIPPGNGG
ncbi:MAG: CoA pyrophosphatase [Chloroflexi bacterium]|nr:CoA pyrophosphatase [Chloroflexota bacterium]